MLRRLADAAKPQTHAEVVDALQDMGFDQSTLFRCLNELSTAGLVARFDLGINCGGSNWRTSAVVPSTHISCASTAARSLAWMAFRCG